MHRYREKISSFQSQGGDGGGPNGSTATTVLGRKLTFGGKRAGVCREGETLLYT